MVVRKYVVLGGIALAGGGAWVYTAQRADKKVPSCCQPKAHAAEATSGAGGPTGGAAAVPSVAASVTATPTAGASVASAGTPAVGPATAPAPGAGSIVVPKDEASLMAALRASKDPSTRLLLAHDGNARFPDGLDRGERTHAAVEALFALGRAAEGRTEAWHFLEAHPDDPWAPKIRAYAVVDK